MQALCAKVSKEKGEYFRKKFTEAQLINKELMIKHNERYLYIPLQSDPKSIEEPSIKKTLLKNSKEIEIIEHDFNKYPKRVNDYKSLLDLPPEATQLLPTSYDLIGSIAIIKIPESIIEYNKMIGEAILNVHKSIRSVACDKGVKGNLRVRDLEIIAGEPKTETTHKQYGIRLTLDVTKVYFSPRLGSEHWRIANLIKPGEVVLDMFAGIGPFSIMIAKYSGAKAIYSIDLNKSAIEYLIRNVDLNKVTNIFPLEGDAKDRIKNVPVVDRIIMNLPLGGDEYLPVALSRIKDTGIIHYHEMLKLDEQNERLKWIETTLATHEYKLLSYSIYNLGSYSPMIHHYCFDLTLKKN